MEEIDVHTWFGLSYASWLTVPRIVLESMPLEWQHQFVKLLNEMNETFDWMPDDLSLSVVGKQDGKFVRLPYLLTDYRHGNIEHLRRRPPVKTGEIKKKTEDLLPCSVCEDSYYVEVVMLRKWKFCPWCGRRLQSGAKREKK